MFKQIKILFKPKLDNIFLHYKSNLIFIIKKSVYFKSFKNFVTRFKPQTLLEQHEIFKEV